jgi:hypothetical protein
MTPQELLRLSDKEVAALYRDWSEFHYCAGWISGGSEEFVDFILDFDPEDGKLEDYELETISKIRELVLSKIPYPKDMK